MRATIAALMALSLGCGGFPPDRSPELTQKLRQCRRESSQLCGMEVLGASFCVPDALRNCMRSYGWEPVGTTWEKQVPRTDREVAEELERQI